MKGFVLAAGFGERMRPITDTVPKPLLPVGRIPLIGYALHLLAYHEITDVLVNLHHLGRAIRDSIDGGATYGVDITYSVEDEILGTGGALRRMHGAIDDTLVVVNSDTLVDVDLHAAIAEHRTRGALATMVLREAPDDAAYGRIEIDAAGRIVRLLGEGELPPGAQAPRSLMFTGVQIIEPRFLEYIPPDVQTCVVRYGYAKALANGEPLFGAVTAGYWADAGTPARYLAVNDDALHQRVALRHADPLAGYALGPRRDVAEVVRMGRDVQLAPQTQLTPPLLLGDDTVLGERAAVGPGAVLGQRVHVGRGAEVRRSIVLDGVRIDANARIEGMLVGRKGSLDLDEVR